MSRPDVGTGRAPAPPPAPPGAGASGSGAGALQPPQPGRPTLEGTFHLMQSVQGNCILVRVLLPRRTAAFSRTRANPCALARSRR
jgi:hypothetical protein